MNPLLQSFREAKVADIYVHTVIYIRTMLRVWHCAIWSDRCIMRVLQIFLFYNSRSLQALFGHEFQPLALLCRSQRLFDV